jgi:hypothetical protein
MVASTPSDTSRRIGHDLGRSAAKQLLQPLLRALTARLLSTLRRVPALTLQEFRLQRAGYGDVQAMLPELLCTSFQQTLERRIRSIVAEVEVCLRL